MNDLPTPKKPWLAALLSFWTFPVGIGYIYVGHWWLFAAALAFEIVLPIALGMVGLGELSPYAVLGICILTAIDAYSIAKRTQASAPNDPITQ